MVAGGVRGCWGACVGYDEIRSMSGRYASYWNAFLLEYEIGFKHKPMKCIIIVEGVRNHC